MDISNKTLAVLKSTVTVTGKYSIFCKIEGTETVGTFLTKADLIPGSKICVLEGTYTEEPAFDKDNKPMPDKKDPTKQHINKNFLIKAIDREASVILRDPADMLGL